MGIKQIQNNKQTLSKMKFFLAALALPAASAFMAAKGPSISTSLNVATGDDSLNGWVPDESKFAYGLPGTLEPAEDFDPPFETASRDIGPAIRHLDEVRASTPFFFEILAVAIGAAEFGRSLKGWATPGNSDSVVLKEGYYPGDIGFDPLGLKPDNFEDFSAMSTKELQHGRLAMLAVAGIVAQELVNGKEIFVNLGVAH